MLIECNTFIIEQNVLPQPPGWPLLLSGHYMGTLVCVPVQPIFDHVDSDRIFQQIWEQNIHQWAGTEPITPTELFELEVLWLDGLC